ncbi:MAG: efflux RND transporter periplasmic adaptor subunit [Blastocatellia bacterium]
MQTSFIDNPDAGARGNIVLANLLRLRWWLAGLLVALALGFLIYRYVPRAAKPEAPATPTTAAPTGTVKFLMEQQWLVRMKLALAEEQTIARQITAIGRVVPAADFQAHVASPVNGIVAGRLPRVGQQVLKGQLLAVLNQTATSAEQAQVRAAVAQVQSQNAQATIENARLEADRRAADGEVKEAKVRFDLASKEAGRAKQLYEQGIIALQDMQRAEAERDAAEAVFQSAEQKRAALNETKPLVLGQTSISATDSNYEMRAPITGYVTKLHKSLGEQVTPGEEVIEVTNLDTVWIEAPIPERDLSRLSGNLAASFTTTAFPDQEFRGKVVDISPIIDEHARAATVIFQVPNRDRNLRIGMQANVRLDAGEQVAVMMIPKEAVLDHEGKKIVYVLLSGEEFERREVTVGDELGGKVVVLTGLKAGERVVTQGAYQLKLQELRPADAGAHSHET